MKKLTVLLALVLSVLLPALAVAEEAEPTPAPVPAEEIMAYTQVYEPETSFDAFLHRGLERRRHRPGRSGRGCPPRHRPGCMWTPPCAVTDAAGQ